MTLNFCRGIDYNEPAAEVAELADAHDSKSCTRKGVRVRFPPSAHRQKNATVTDTVAFFVREALYQTSASRIALASPVCDNAGVSRAPLIALLLLLVAGAGLGLYLGWVVSPVAYVDTAPDSLQAAYKDDYLLMVATAFAGDQDLAAARASVAELGFADPAAAVTAAASRLAAAGYPESDLRRMAALVEALGAASPTPSAERTSAATP